MRTFPDIRTKAPHPGERKKSIGGSRQPSCRVFSCVTRTNGMSTREGKKTSKRGKPINPATHRSGATGAHRRVKCGFPLSIQELHQGHCSHGFLFVLGCLLLLAPPGFGRHLRIILFRRRNFPGVRLLYILLPAGRATVNTLEPLQQL